jgi:predicted signal transduction protein with EAL and GGDEF domain
MGANASTGLAAPGVLATRALGTLGVAGGLLAVVAALTPPSATHSDALVILAGVLSGAAVGPVDGHQLEDLWKVADRAMYEAKRAGGDRVAVAPPVAEPPLTALGGAAALVEP